MTQSQIKNIFFALLSCILFFADLMIFALLQRHQIYVLLCFFIVLIVAKAQHRALIIPLFLLSIMSYLETNIFGWCLVYIMPTMLFANYLDQHLRVKVIIPYLLITFTLCTKIILAWYMHDVATSWASVTEIITYNSFIVALFAWIGSWFEKKFGISE